MFGMSPFSTICCLLPTFPVTLVTCKISFQWWKCLKNSATCQPVFLYFTCFLSWGLNKSAAELFHGNQLFFICLLLLEMMALTPKGPFLAVIGKVIYSEPLGYFYTSVNSVTTICQYGHHHHHAPICEAGLREREGGRLWFVQWVQIVLFFCSPPHLWIPWLTDGRTKLLSTHLCVSHVLLEAPQL